MKRKFLTLALPCLLVSSAFSQTAFAQVADDEIIVTGARILEGSIDDAITGVSVLKGDDLSDRLAANIGETLKAEPGVSSTFFGAGASRPIIRGQGGDRVRVLTNGIGSIDASSASPDHAVAAEPAQADQIEVLRGASLLRFGSSGSGGVVNIIDGRIPQNIPDGVEGAFRLGASSVDLGREVAASIDTEIANNLVLHLDGTWRDADNYKIPGFAESEIFHEAEEEGHEDEDEHHDDDHDEEDEERLGEAFGRLDNSWSRSNSLSAGLSYIGADGYIGVAVNGLNSRYGVPGGHGHGEEGHGHDEEEHDEDHHEEDEHEEEGHSDEEDVPISIRLKQVRVDMNGTKELDGFLERIQAFAGYADYEHTELEGAETGTVFANKGWESRIEAIQTQRNDWRAAYGVQLRERKFSAIGEEAFVPPTTTRQYAGYMFHEKELGTVHLEGAARYEITNQTNDSSSQDREFNLFSLSGGADIHLTDKIRFGATVFRTERAPTSEELYSNGPHLATEAFELGDPNLSKEIAKGVELSYRHRGKDHYVTGNLFYTEYDDFIFENRTGAFEDGLDVFQFVGDDATFKGFEIQGKTKIGNINDISLSLDGIVEYVRAKTDTGNLPRIPPLSVLVGGEAQWNNLKLRAEYDYADSQDRLGDEELPTDSYGLVNLFLTWKLPVEQDLTFRLSAFNIGDEEARQHASYLKDIVPLPGRNIRFSLGAKF